MGGPVTLLSVTNTLSLTHTLSLSQDFVEGLTRSQP